MSAKKTVGTLVLIGLVVAGVATLSSDPAPTPRGGTPGANGEGPTGASPGSGGVAEERAPFQRAEECRSCHEDVWAEWIQSYHGKAWTDPMVQALADGFRMQECIDCHAPQPIHVTGVEQRVAPRLHARSNGVDCLSCHILEDGVSVAAARTVDNSSVAGACSPVATPSMTTSTSCVGCHNQHETVNEVMESGTGKDCQDCHMTSVERSGRSGRSHIFPGAHSIDMHRQATKLEVAVKDGKLIASVTNVGGAHHIPTDARHRSYNLWVRLADERGNPIQDDVQMVDGEFRLYYRNQFKPSTQLRHMETRAGTWTLPEGVTGTARVRLTYALNPELLDSMDVYEVHEQEVKF